MVLKELIFALLFHFILSQELLPLVLFFELPITGGLQPDMNSPAVQHVVQTCNVAVNMKQKGRGFSTTVTVRGAADNPVGVKEACLKLMEHLAGTVGVSITFTHH